VIEINADNSYNKLHRTLKHKQGIYLKFKMYELETIKLNYFKFGTYASINVSCP
jgi:hypothetical protein